MSESRSVARAFLVASAIGACLLAGCARTGTSSAPGPALVDDTAAAESASVTASRGASFMHGTAEGTAAVIALPGAFEPGTKVTFTPLTSGGEDVLQPGFRIEAESGAQPKAPVFVAFAVPGKLPDDAAVFAYEDGSAEGVKVTASVTSSGGVTSILAPVSHLTGFRVERRGGAAPAASEGATPTGWIDFDSTTPYIYAHMPGDAWDSEFTLSGRLVDAGGGAYVGPMKLAYYGDLDIEGTTGMASAEWTGPMQFSELQIVWNPDWWLPASPSEEGTGGIIDHPRSPFTLTTTGQYIAIESQAFLAWLEVEGIGRRRVPVDVKKSIFPAGTVGCSLWIDASGVLAIVGDRESAGDYMPAGPFRGEMGTVNVW